MNQESEPVRQFKGVWIPREIWEHPDLTWLEKCLLAEIDSLSRHEKPCTASNGWLGKRFNVSEERMANIISDLRHRGFIEDVGFNGRIRSIRVHGFREGCIHGNQQEGFTETVNSESPPVCTTENSEREENPHSRGGARSCQPPDQKEFQQYCAMKCIPDSEAAKCFLYYSARHWLDRNGFVMDWKPLVINWLNRAREKDLLRRDKEQSKSKVF